MASKKGTRGIVYFCPELRLYRYRYNAYEQESGKKEELGELVDYKFDTDELEELVVALLATGDTGREAEANFVANITGLARTNPHKIVRFDTGSDKIEIVEPGPFWDAHDQEKAEKEKAEAAAGHTP